MRALHLKLELLRTHWSPLVLSRSNRRKRTRVFSWIMLSCSSLRTLHYGGIKFIFCRHFILKKASCFKFSWFLHYRRSSVCIKRVTSRLLFNNKLCLQLRKYELFCSLSSQIFNINWLVLSKKTNELIKIKRLINVHYNFKKKSKKGVGTDLFP